MNSSILLINPVPGIYWKYIKDNLNLSCPINMLSLGSFLEKQGFEIYIVDAAVDENYFDKISTIIKKSYFL